MGAGRRRLGRDQRPLVSRQSPDGQDGEHHGRRLHACRTLGVRCLGALCTCYLPGKQVAHNDGLLAVDYGHLRA